MPNEPRNSRPRGGTCVFRPFRSLLIAWFFSVLGWGAVSLALGWQMASALSLPASDVLRIVGLGWLGWSFVTPLIFRFVRQFPIERERWKVSLPIHLVVGFALVACIGWFGQTFGPSRIGPPPPTQPGTQSVMRPPPARGPLGGLLFGPNLPIYLAILSVSHALYFYRRGRERELRAVELTGSLAEARLQALRMQIQPHFLFNSLNVLGGLMHKDIRAADEMLIALSDFLRLTLEDSGEQEVPLHRELESIDRYLAVEKVRFGPRLSYCIQASPETHAALVPALLLQPIVENAVRHGIEPRLDSGQIIVRVAREGESLRLNVSDNGVGVKITPRMGVGLANTRERLRELYGGAGMLQITSEHGTEVEIRVPFRTVA